MKKDFDRKVYLREEAESPFRKIRFFAYFGLGAGALISLAVSSARVAAGLAGINADLLQESATNVGVDITGLVVLGLAYVKDKEAQESRIARATKGAALAKLMVKLNKAVQPGNVEEGVFTTELSSLRRGRGMDKRIVICVAAQEKLDELMEKSIALENSLSESDLLIVPVLPSGASPVKDEIPLCVGLPVGRGWNEVVQDEMAQARQQNIDTDSEVIGIILKKNGRVGQRTKGVFLDRLVGDVSSRKELGMDTANI